MTRMTWPTWRADADKEAGLAMDSLRKIFSDPSLLTMTRQALANDGHCKLNSPDALVASLAFEQVYVARLTNLVQDKGNFWGGRDAEPAAQCAWERASRLLTPEAARTLSRDGIVVIDGALTASEVAAARAEIDALDERGELKVVEAQSKARIRNDRIGWVACSSSNSTSGGGPPGLRLVGKLLRAIPAAVEARQQQEGGDNTRFPAMSVPTTVMCATYDGSPEQPTYYTRHFDGRKETGGGKDTNPRVLTAIIYLNEKPPWDVNRDGGCLRAWPPHARADGGHIDIEPIGGRMLIFDAIRVEHEVRPSYRRRCAVTLWANGIELLKGS